MVNVRFKMPKFGRKVKSKDVLKELFLTFLATTISIVLTFGTAALIEKKERTKDRHLAALMAMSNIEQFSRILDCIAYANIQSDTLATWLLTFTPEELDRLPSDTIQPIVNRVLSTKILSHDQTAENIFTNHIETWKNLGNFIFIDNVGTCFSRIDKIENRVNKSHDDIRAAIDDVNRYEENYKGKCLHTKYLFNPVIRDFLKNRAKDVNFYRYIAANLRFENRQNMSLIGIDEKEVLDLCREREQDPFNMAIVNMTRKEAMQFYQQREYEVHVSEEMPEYQDFTYKIDCIDSLVTIKPLIQWADSIIRAK